MSLRMDIGREERLEAKRRAVGNVIHKGLLRDSAEFVRKGQKKNRRGGRVSLFEWEIYLSLRIQLFFYMLNFECSFYGIPNHVLGYF